MTIEVAVKGDAEEPLFSKVLTVDAALLIPAGETQVQPESVARQIVKGLMPDVESK
jgi:hypothetical protein